MSTYINLWVFFDKSRGIFKVANRENLIIIINRCGVSLMITDEEGNLLPDEGNPYRDVWKTVVWKKLADDRVNPAEKAIFAALSGCLEALLPLCTDWEDHLWAHLKVMVDVAIELHLRNSRGADIGRLPEEYPKENETIDHVLRYCNHS